MSSPHPAFLETLPIPPERKRLYAFLRGLLFISFFTIMGMLGYSFLFPSQGFTIDFHNPDAAKNTLLDPRGMSGSPLREGSVKKNSVLIVNGGALGTFSDADISVRLRKHSILPENISLSIQKGYRAMFLPEGAPAEFPAWNHRSGDQIFRVDGDIYQLSEGTLYRFSSEVAALSRTEPDAIIDATSEILSRYPIADEWIGFRPGTLLSFADGVFVVYSETEIRPIGSAEIFQAIGYDWNDVISASEEEIGSYKRGKMILPGTLHAPGTLFYTIETGAYFTIDEKHHRRPITDPSLLSFSLRHAHAIPVSEKSRELAARCELKARALFPREYACESPLQDISDDLAGNDYQFTFTPSSDIDMESIALTLDRSPEKGNLRSAISQLKTRILDRYSPR